MVSAQKRLLLRGRDLANFIRTHGGKKENMEVYMRLFSGMIKGLYTLHTTNQCHRDIKPANIFLSGTDLDSMIPKLGDFGLARNVT
jgi:serine/threonine protein kinase